MTEIFRPTRQTSAIWSNGSSNGSMLSCLTSEVPHSCPIFLTLPVPASAPQLSHISPSIFLQSFPFPVISLLPVSPVAATYIPYPHLLLSHSVFLSVLSKSQFYLSSTSLPQVWPDVHIDGQNMCMTYKLTYSCRISKLYSKAWACKT